MEKAIILGFDGLDHALLRRFLQEGKLPNFQKLAQKGVLAPLRSTIPPLTPQAWTSMITGVNPGKHGVFDFGEIPRDGYEPKLVHSNARLARGFWEYLENEGFSCGILNIPLSWPAEKLRLGYMSGGMHTPSLSEYSPDSRVMEELLAIEGSVIDVMSYWYQDMQGFVDAVMAMEERRLQLIQRLRKKAPVDVLMAVFVGVDRICHALWGMQDFVVGEQGWKLQNAVQRIYELMDSFLGEILRDVPDSTLVLVVSDHGFGSLEKDVYLNNWLERCGWLKFSPPKLIQEMVGHPNWQHGVLGKAALEVAARFPGFLRSIPPLQKSFDAVDWSKTKAFSAGLFGNVHLNRRHRFPEGFLVRDKEEYNLNRRSVMDDLLALRDEDGGVVNHIWLAEDIYHGPALDMAPDLILNMRDYAMITRGGYEFRSNLIFDTPAVHHSGNHRMDGVLIACGAGVDPQRKVSPQAHLMDMTPTLLAHMGLPIPEDMDGRVLTELFRPPVRIRRNQETVYRQFRGNEQPEKPSEEVLSRLKNLGYID